MTAPRGWIEEARQMYERAPWVAVALSLGVAIAEPLDSASEAGRACARRHGLDAIALLARRAPAGVVAALLAGAVAELRDRGISPERLDAELAHAQREARS